MFAMKKTASRALKITFLLGFFAAGFSLSAQAEKREILGSFRDWDSVLIERDSGEKHCMMISMPKRSDPTNVIHGEVYMTVTHRPRRKVRDEINFVAGYDLRVGSEANGTIGNTPYTMFAEGRNAWNYTQEDDRRMVTSMKRGNTLIVRATSARGTKTTYRFSLIGFTAAYNAITEACS